MNMGLREHGEHRAEGIWGNIGLREHGEHRAEGTWGNMGLREHGGWENISMKEQKPLGMTKENRCDH